ncbi:hypothetical protein ACRQ5Q_24495 [Bradyrhizobium sp. PMVTL-01]|uniref:hypothetical protein n=1 Tax=Bradyrhizobium sp. PMVTL-01 TaxID=3434999 RepID=UPI003F728921
MSYSGNQALFTARTTDGNSNGADWPGGRGVFAVVGTFNGATVKLQWTPDGTNWLDVDQNGDTFVTKTAAGHGGFELPQCQVRAAQSGSGGATSLTTTVGGLRV